MLNRTTHTGQPLSADLTTADALRLPWGGTAQRYNAASRLDRDRSQRHLQAWDFTPHKDVPYVCRGLRPPSSPEGRPDPWAKAALNAWDDTTVHGGTCAGLGIATAGLHNLDDGRHDSIVDLHKKRSAEDKAYAEATHRNPWDFTQWFNTPSSLRGISLVTAEPWEEDENEYMQFEEARRQVDWETSRANQRWEAVPNRLSPSPMELAFTDPAKHGQHRKGAIVVAPVRPPAQMPRPSRRPASAPQQQHGAARGGAVTRAKAAAKVSRSEVEA